MDEAVRQAVAADRPGWVTRCYPAVLDTWQQLSPAARDAARVLYSSAGPGQVVEIRHATFYRYVACSDESASRKAFRRLEEAGVLRCVFKGRGCQARTLYRLGDPRVAYERRGLGIVEPDPQLMLPFAAECLAGAEMEDLGAGILRLVVPPESGRTAGFEAQQSGRTAGFDAQQSGHAAGFDQQSGHAAGFDQQSGHAAGFDGAAEEPAEANFRIFSGGQQAGATDARQTRPKGTETQGGVWSQPPTRQGTEGPAGPSAVGATAKEAGGGDAGPARSGSPVPPGPFGRRPARLGTAAASRAPAPVGITNTNTNLSSKETSHFNSNPPITNHQSGATASASVGEGAGLDVDRLIEGVQRADDARMDRVAKRILRAVRQAEHRLEIRPGDPHYMRSEWPVYEWARQVVDVTVEIGEGHVQELVYDLAAIPPRTDDNPDGLLNPGGLVVGRLRRLYEWATGKDLPRRGQTKKPR